MLTLFTCKYCVEHHGMIVDISILDYKLEVDVHERCKCVYVPMRTKRVGTATNIGYNGADAQLFYRILYSNDGLIFVTYDHYQTFYEMIK